MLHSPHHLLCGFSGLSGRLPEASSSPNFSESCSSRQKTAISYNIAALLSQLLADGVNAWHYHAGCGDAAMAPVALAFSHTEVSEQVVATIDKYKPPGNRSISYFSLFPLLSTVEKLLHVTYR